MKLNDWKRQAEEYRDVDRAAQAKAEAEIAATAHGAERDRKEVTDVFPGVPCETTDGHSFTMPGGSHTYTQAEKFCQGCGWITCKGVIDFIVCPKCHADW